MYQKNTENGYIVSVVSGVSKGNISESEYLNIRALISDAPEAPDGFGYRLREDLEWELYELPESPEIPEEATEADYREALERLGVSTYA